MLSAASDGLDAHLFHVRGAETPREVMNASTPPAAAARLVAAGCGPPAAVRYLRRRFWAVCWAVASAALAPRRVPRHAAAAGGPRLTSLPPSRQPGARVSLAWSCLRRLGWRAHGAARQPFRYLCAADYDVCGLAVLLAMPPSVTSSRASSVAASASVPVLFVCVSFWSSVGP